MTEQKTMSLPQLQRILSRPDIWALLLISLASLALYAIVDPGNTIGLEEWSYTRSILDVNTTSYFDLRPLRLLFPYLVAHSIGAGPEAMYVGMIAVRMLSAWVYYGLIRLLLPEERQFALAVALVFVVYTISDEMLVRPIYMLMFGGDVLLILLALYLAARYWLGESWGFLLGGALIAIIAIQEYETTFPLLFSTPILLVLLRRDWSRRSWIMLTVMLLACTAALTPRMLLPLLGLSSETYSSGLLRGADLSPLTLANSLATQLRFAFLDPLLLSRPDLTDLRLPTIPMASTVLGGLWVVWHRLSSHQSETLSGWRTWTVSALLGLILTAAGVFPFLITFWALLIERVHILAAPAEALALISAIWLVAAMLPQPTLRDWFRVGGLALLLVFGIASMSAIQSSYDNLSARWERQSTFLRSLAQIAPAPGSNILIIYVENPQAPFDVPASFADEIPFTRVWAFENSVRLMYSGQVYGVIGSESPYTHFHTWEFDDMGIHIRPQGFILGSPLAYEADFTWDQVLVVTRDAHSQAQILPVLPPGLSTPARDALYDPSALVTAGWVPSRAQQLFPPYLDASRRFSY